MKVFFSICVAFALCVCCYRSQLQASPPPAVTATIQLANGQTMTFTDFSNQIGIQPHDYVNITIKFPPDLAGQPVIIDPIDGGASSFGASIPVTDANGSITFGFLAPNKTGLKSLRFRIGSSSYRLQFSLVKGN